jgi:hypothetical protein
VTTSTWPSDVRRLCDGLIPRLIKKHLLRKEKKKKCKLYRPGGLHITINELRQYKIAIAAIQGTRWNKLTAQAFTSNGFNIYTSSLANNHEFGTAILVDLKFNHLDKNFTPINEHLCVVRIEGIFFNYSLINIHAPTNDSEEEAKDQFYAQLERAYAACLSHDVKLVMGDVNAKVGRETVHQPTIGTHSLHENANENGLRLVDFAAGRQMAIKSTYFIHKRIHLQTWHFSVEDTFLTWRRRVQTSIQTTC